MDLLKNNTFRVIIIVLLIILVILSVFLLQLKSQNNKQSASNLLPSPTTPVISVIPVTTMAYTIPTLQPERGRGIDINSPVVQKSQQLINILKDSLPYEKTFKTSNGVETSIVIPQNELQDAAWVLMIDIYGIDYQVPPNDPQYLVMKEAFREAVNDTFNWMKSKGIEPQTVIVSWGDKEFIRNRADEWLK